MRFKRMAKNAAVLPGFVLGVLWLLVTPGR